MKLTPQKLEVCGYRIVKISLS